MKIEKLPSGSYRARMTQNKKTYSVTFPFKPTDRQAYEALIEKINNPNSSKSVMTYSTAYSEYISIKENVLSPSTIRGYESIFKNTPESLKRMRLDQIDSAVVQKYVNIYAADHSPKSTRNYYGLIYAIMYTFIPSMHISVTLPQKIKKEPYIPSEEEVKKIFEYFKGTKYECVIILMAMGLRRGEACAITSDDLDGNVLHISKSKVLTKDNKWVVKPFPKNTNSTRSIIIPDMVAELIRKQGYVYNDCPNEIYKPLRRAERALGIQQFSGHKLRHYFISYAHSLGITNANIMTMTGHSSEKTLTEIYRHSMKKQEAQEEIANQYKSLLS